MGQVKLLLGFMFLPLWCRWGNRGSPEPAPAGFPGKIDLKTARAGLSPCLASMEVALQVALLPAPGRGLVLAPVCCGFCPVPAFGWERNDLKSVWSIPRGEGGQERTGGL